MTAVTAVIYDLPDVLKFTQKKTEREKSDISMIFIKRQIKLSPEDKANANYSSQSNNELAVVNWTEKVS